MFGHWFSHMIHEPDFLRMAVELLKIIPQNYIYDRYSPPHALKGSNYGISQDMLMTCFIIYILY